jgi:hypothetical protein
MNTRRLTGILSCCLGLPLSGCFSYAIPGLPDDDSTVGENIEIIDMDAGEDWLETEGLEIEAVENSDDTGADEGIDPGTDEADGEAGDEMEDTSDSPADEGELPSPMTCPDAGTLEELVTCIAGHMPDLDSEGFVVPSDAVLGDWSVVVAQMLGGRCDDIALPSSLSPAYSVGAFVDGDNHHSYCVLMEILDDDANGKVDRGWGTFMTSATASREINVQVAHPLSDTRVEVEGAGIFKGIDGRSYLLAGAHREANSSPSACQAMYTDSDVAHNIANCFQATTVQMKSFYDVLGADFTVFQFHGMATTTCPGVNVYLTRGLSSTPVAADLIFTLKANLLAHNPTWVVSVPGDTPACSLNGTTNVQGCFLNGVEAGSVCFTAASSSTGIFYYTEQILASRNAGDWVSAIIETLP